MKKLNNKGQVLVVFVLLLPIFFIILAALVELGDLLVYQNKLESNAKDIITYGVKNLDDADLEEKIQTLNDKNFSGKAKVKITDKDITVTVNEKKKNVFTFLKIPLSVNFTYRGYLEEKKLIIKKE